MICYLKLYDYIGMDNVRPDDYIGMDNVRPGAPHPGLPPDGPRPEPLEFSIVSRAYQATSFRDTL
ncbi:hypothetical protein CFR72_03665 [Gluconacetobacter entanii]|uniref:Uncharacterized protein n=1 Tax=Gluconacetobacter entanii TaxID=108528 RepID=A0A318PY81_9PROT|nr:hypothetical protein CFR72_03665 [Gluconacetobacter entanii]